MRLRITFIAPGLIAAFCACAPARPASSDTNPKPEAAFRGTAAPLANVAPAELAQPDEVGEVVEAVSDKLWIVFQDSKGRHWFGSDGQGAYRSDGKTLVRYTTADGLINDHVRQIQEDGAGNLYFNTGGGISKFDGRRFSTLVPIESGTSASEWKSEPGDLWFTGRDKDNGPYRWDGRSLKHLEFPRIALEDVFNSLAPGAPYSPYAVYTIHRDRRGALWFGTAILGVCRYDGSSFSWITEDELTELDVGAVFGVRGIMEDKDGRFWLGNLLHRYDAYPDGASGRSAAAPWYLKEPGVVVAGDSGEPGNAYFMSGLTDRQGVSWVATYGAGVWRLEGEQLTHIPVTQGGQPITLYSIHEDREGVVWLGTQAAGAWRFNGRDFERFRP